MSRCGYLSALDDNPRLLDTANLGSVSVSRVREQLERFPELAAMDDPVELWIQAVVALNDQLMRRMR